METIWKVFSCFVALLFLELCNGLPLDLDRSLPDGHTQLLTGLIAVLLTICGVVCLAGCLCCQRRNGFKEFRDSPVVISVASNLDHGHVNPIANGGEFTIFTPLSPPHHNNNVFLANQQVITRAEEDFKNGDIDVTSWFDSNEKDFPRTRLKYIKEFGKGWFGRVVEGTAQGLEDDDTIWTPVIVRILEASASSRQRVLFLHDAKIYKCPKHPNLLRLLGRSLESIPLLLLQEHLTQGDLKLYLRKQKSAKETFLTGELPLRWCHQLASAVKHLHDHNITHPDLAARNCQISEELNLKLGDYGCSTSDYPEDYYHGTENVPVRWCAPECVLCTATTIQTKNVTMAGNIWSLGVCLWEIYECGEQPYSNLSDDEVVSQVLGPPNVRLPKPSLSVLYTDYVYKLMQLCWSAHELRPSISQIDLMLVDLVQVHKNSTSTLEDPPVSIQDFDARWENFKPNDIVKKDNHIIQVIEPENDLTNITVLNMSMKNEPDSKILSASLHNLAGSFDNLLESGRTETSWTNNSETEDLSFTNAIRDLDSALAAENITSSSDSSPKIKFKLGPVVKTKSKLMPKSSSESETEDELWRKKIEKGVYTEKVRIKSRSVADLMILTHIDYSESDSETPLTSLDYANLKSWGNPEASLRNNYKNVRYGPKQNLESSLTFGSEGNLLSVQDTFQEELKKLQEERRDSLLFVPDNKLTSSPETKKVLEDLNSPANLEPQNQVFNVYNCVAISPKYSPIHKTIFNSQKVEQKQDRMINEYTKPSYDKIESKSLKSSDHNKSKAQVLPDLVLNTIQASKDIPKLSEIIESNIELMDYIVLKYDDLDYVDDKNKINAVKNSGKIVDGICHEKELIDDEGYDSKERLDTIEPQVNTQNDYLELEIQNEYTEDATINDKSNRQNDKTPIETIKSTSNDSDKPRTDDNIKHLSDSKSASVERKSTQQINRKLTSESSKDSLCDVNESDEGVRSEGSNFESSECLDDNFGQHLIHEEVLCEKLKRASEESSKHLNREQSLSDKLISEEILNASDASKKLNRDISESKQPSNDDNLSIKLLREEISNDIIREESNKLFPTESSDCLVREKESPKNYNLETKEFLKNLIQEETSSRNSSCQEITSKEFSKKLNQIENSSNVSSSQPSTAEEVSNNLNQIEQSSKDTNIQEITTDESAKIIVNSYDTLNFGEEENLETTAEAVNSAMLEKFNENVEKTITTNFSSDHTEEKYESITNEKIETDSPKLTRENIPRDEEKSLENSAEELTSQHLQSQKVPVERSSEEKKSHSQSVEETINESIQAEKEIKSPEEEITLVKQSIEEQKQVSEEAKSCSLKTKENSTQIILAEQNIATEDQNNLPITKELQENDDQTIESKYQTITSNLQISVEGQSSTNDFKAEELKTDDSKLKEQRIIETQLEDSKPEELVMVLEDTEETEVKILELEEVNSTKGFVAESKEDHSANVDDSKAEDHFRESKPTETNSLKIDIIETNGTEGSNETKVEFIGSKEDSATNAGMLKSKEDISSLPELLLTKDDNSEGITERKEDISSTAEVVKTKEINALESKTVDLSLKSNEDLPSKETKEDLSNASFVNSGVNLDNINKTREFLSCEVQKYDSQNAVNFDLSETQDVCKNSSLFKPSQENSVILGASDDYSIDYYSGLKTTNCEEFVQKSGSPDMKYSLETWDNFLGRSFDEQPEFDGFSTSEPQSMLFLENQERGNVAEAKRENNGYSVEKEDDSDEFPPPPTSMELVLSNEDKAMLSQHYEDEDDEEEVVNKTFNLDDLNRTYDVINESGNNVVDLSDINVEMEDSIDEKQGYDNPGYWENENSGGWFLHPQSGAEDLSGQMDVSEDDSYVGFSMDDEIMAAIRNELLTKLPQAQRASAEQIDDGDGEFETTDRNEVFVRYNCYNTPLSPIPEESYSELLNSGQSTPHCTINTDLGDADDSDWSEPGIDPNSILDDDTHSPRMMESPHKGPLHRHTPSQDSCCSNDTLFNLEELQYTEKMLASNLLEEALTTERFNLKEKIMESEILASPDEENSAELKTPTNEDLPKVLESRSSKEDEKCCKKEEKLAFILKQNSEERTSLENVETVDSSLPSSTDNTTTRMLTQMEINEETKVQQDNLNLSGSKDNNEIKKDCEEHFQSNDSEKVFEIEKRNDDSEDEKFVSSEREFFLRIHPTMSLNISPNESTKFIQEERNCFDHSNTEKDINEINERYDDSEVQIKDDECLQKEMKESEQNVTTETTDIHKVNSKEDAITINYKKDLIEDTVESSVLVKSMIEEVAQNDEENILKESKCNMQNVAKESSDFINAEKQNYFIKQKQNAVLKPLPKSIDINPSPPLKSPSKNSPHENDVQQPSPKIVIFESSPENNILQYLPCDDILESSTDNAVFQSSPTNDTLQSSSASDILHPSTNDILQSSSINNIQQSSPKDDLPQTSPNKDNIQTSQQHVQPNHTVTQISTNNEVTNTNQSSLNKVAEIVETPEIDYDLLKSSMKIEVESQDYIFKAPTKKDIEDNSSSSETYLTVSDGYVVPPLNSPEDRPWKHIEASLTICPPESRKNFDNENRTLSSNSDDEDEIIEYELKSDDVEGSEKDDNAEGIRVYNNVEEIKKSVAEDRCIGAEEIKKDANGICRGVEKLEGRNVGEEIKSEIIMEECNVKIKQVEENTAEDTNIYENIQEFNRPNKIHYETATVEQINKDRNVEEINDTKAVNMYENIEEMNLKNSLATTDYVNAEIVKNQPLEGTYANSEIVDAVTKQNLVYANVEDEIYANESANCATCAEVNASNKNCLETENEYSNSDLTRDDIYDCVHAESASQNVKLNPEYVNNIPTYVNDTKSNSSVQYVNTQPEYENHTEIPIVYENMNYDVYIDLLNDDPEVEYDHIGCGGSVEDVYGPLTDIRFTGPGDSQMMTTSFSDSNDLGDEQDWDSGSDTRSSSSGEFIWKEGEHEASVKALHAAPQDAESQQFEAQREEEDSSSGSEEDCEGPEFVPSAWDKHLAPTKSALRSPEKTEKKNRGVSFKKQKYHCVYEYPREPESPIIQGFDIWQEHPNNPIDWDVDRDTEMFLPAASSDTEAFGEAGSSSITQPQNHSNKQHRNLYQTSNVPDFIGSSILDDDFYISSSAKPFDMFNTASSQFFPGRHCDWSELIKNNDNITPDSGVEDITPGSLSDSSSDYIRPVKQILPLKTLAQLAINNSKGAQTANNEIGGLRHTRNRLKLDLPPSPSAFTKSFSLEPVLDVVNRQIPTFTTFGKSRFVVQQVDTPTDESNAKNVSFEALPYKPLNLKSTDHSYFFDNPRVLKADDHERSLRFLKGDDINSLTTHVYKDDHDHVEKTRVEIVRGEASLLDSADEDSGIESCTLERKRVSGIPLK